jgi:hypothetical protein
MHAVVAMTGWIAVTALLFTALAVFAGPVPTP